MNSPTQKLKIKWLFELQGPNNVTISDEYDYNTSIYELKNIKQIIGYIIV